MAFDTDLVLNDRVPPARGANIMPEGLDEAPCDLGLASVRVTIDRLLSPMHGFDDEHMALVGLTLSDLASHRAEFTAILAEIALHDGARPGRGQARSAAIRLIGHLRLSDAREVLLDIAMARHERPSHRAAAIESLGRMGAKSAESTLIDLLGDARPQVVAAAAGALAALGSVRARSLLKELAAGAVDARVRTRCDCALQELEGGDAQARSAAAPVERHASQPVDIRVARDR